MYRQANVLQSRHLFFCNFRDLYRDSRRDRTLHRNVTASGTGTAQRCDGRSGAGKFGYAHYAVSRTGIPPMLFELPPAAQELQSVARRLAETAIAARAVEVDRTEEYPWDNVAALRDAGLLGYTIPREYGGAGGSFLDAVVIIEEMARVCGVTGRIAVETNMGAISAVMQYGSEAQRRLAARLVLGGDKPAICITEREAGSAATEMTTCAEQRNGYWLLNGCKH